MIEADTLFAMAPEVPDNAAGQWRISRVQIYNWGTMQGQHDLKVPRKGLLLTGESGSGKSTIVDALTTVLYPDMSSSFNAAAAAGTGGDSARSRLTYVRGAYGRDTDEITHESRTRYLREKATRSGIALTFNNGADKVWSAVRVFYIAADSMVSNDLKTLFFSMAEDVTLADAMECIVDSSFASALRKAYPHASFAQNSSAFQSRLQRSIGIGSDTASALLHKTIATKNLSSLNDLMRSYMLDEPKTEELADVAVEQFQDLRAAHHNVVDAERQIAALKPIRERMKKQEEERSAEAEFDRLLGLVDLYRSSLNVEFAQRGMKETSKQKQATDTERQRLRSDLDASRHQLDSLRAQHDRLGGVRIARLEGDREVALTRLENCKERHAEVAPAFSVLDSEVPRKAEEFAHACQRARDEIKGIQKQRHGLTEEKNRVSAQKYDLMQRKNMTRKELESLARRSSAIPSQLIELREDMASDLAMDPSAFPFVGELLDVKDPQWRPAIERLLHGFGQTMLVANDHADRVAVWVNERRLMDRRGRGMRLVYERVPARTTKTTSETKEKSVILKLAIKDSPFSGWLYESLTRRFNYVCVDSIHELAAHSHALTKEGLIRSRARHDKDDRHAVTDSRRWILGTTNHERVEALQATLKENEGELDRVSQHLDRLNEQTRMIDQSETHLQRLVSIEWASIDIDSHSQTVEVINRELEKLASPESEVGKLSARIGEVQDWCAQLEDNIQELTEQIGGFTRDLDSYENTIDTHQRIYGDQFVNEDDAVALHAVCAPDRRRITQQILDESIQRGRSELEERKRSAADRRSDAEGHIQTLQAKYLREWPTQSTNLEAGIGSVPDFLNRLTALENDNLPKFKEKFRELLAQQTQQSITLLSTEIRRAFSDVRQRIRPVNESLAMTPYDRHRQHFLDITVLDARKSVVREFLDELKAITEGYLSMESDTDEEANRRFERVEQLMTQLSSEEREWRHWRKEVLDTRQHVAFRATVRDSEGMEIDNYEGSQGRSGGQSQKLVTFCLAAALRYQLADENEIVPRYGTIVLDEAFDKTDTDFTKDSLEVFKTFGFQLILATPMKMIQTFEPYLGGVIEVALLSDHTSKIAQVTFADVGGSHEDRS